MNIGKIKYRIAVAAVVTAAAFCGCDSEEKEIIRLDTVKSRESSPDEHVESSTIPETIKVYVCGAVKAPDVYSLPAGVRVIDAVNAAGGFAADAGYEYLNLAASVSDAQKVYIPTNAEIEEAIAEGEELYGAQVNITSNTPGVSGSALSTDSGDQNDDQTGGQDGKVNINQADRQTLMTLPGRGQSKADKIIAYREANGGFASIEDILLVGGIKEGLFNKVRDRICVK